jgi:hypothetical protein
MNVVLRFENGVFRPLQPVSIQEGTLIEVQVDSAGPRAQANVAEPGAPVTALFDSGAFGLWQDREDIVDSVEFVNELRSRVRG